MAANGVDAKGGAVCVWCECRTADPDGICFVCRNELNRLENEWREAEACARVAEEFTSDRTPMLREFIDLSADQDAPGEGWQLAGIALTDSGPRAVYVRKPFIARAR